MEKPIPVQLLEDCGPPNWGRALGQDSCWKYLEECKKVI